MRTLTRRFVAAGMCVSVALPGAWAQHAAKAVAKAAHEAGILLRDATDHDGKLKNLMLAFDPGSPLEALQKLATLARSASVDESGRGTLSVQQLCKFYESLKRDPDYINNADWRRFQSMHGRFLDYLLFDRDRHCGAGPVQSIVLQDAPDGRYVWINLKERIDYSFPGGHYSTKTNQVRYRLSASPEHSAQIMADYASSGEDFEDNFRDAGTNRVRENLKAQEVATAMTHVREGAVELDRAKVIRTLSNYDVLSIQPVSRDDHLRYLHEGNRHRHMEIGAMAIISPQGLATHGKDDAPFRKGIAVLRAYEFNGQHSIDGRVNQIEIPRAVKAEGEWKPVVEGTLASVNRTMDEHFGAVQKTGVGLMYGPSSEYAKMSPEERERHLARHRRPGSAVPTPKETSCIGFVLNQLEAGYKQAGKEERWKEIAETVRKNNGEGTHLLNELKKDGWTTIYWNPDRRYPAENVLNPSKDSMHHIWTASEVAKGKPYLQGVRSLNGERFAGIPIDEQMLDYRPTNPYHTTPRTEDIEKLRRAPLFVGIANGGYHVYLGSQGQVIESHASRGPTDPSNIEIRPFTEWGLLQGESYLSGVIAVPPGSWK